jgi:hypothetical protein
MKYKVEVGSFVTRLVSRKLIIHASNEEEAKQKAIDKYIEEESKVISSNDAGEPRVDFIDVID